MQKVRVKFSKTGRAKYISHLDMNRCMQRSFKRSDVPIKYTEGFNPHAYIMFPLALSLGVESVCEFMDFSVTDNISLDDIKKRLNNSFPEGLEVIDIGEPTKKHTEIEKAQYDVTISGISKLDFKNFMGQETIFVEKRTKKKGMVSLDIKPDFEIISSNESENGLEITLTAPAGTVKNLNPLLLTEALSEFCSSPHDVKIMRTRIICVDGKDFF